MNTALNIPDLAQEFAQLGMIKQELQSMSGKADEALHSAQQSQTQISTYLKDFESRLETMEERFHSIEQQLSALNQSAPAQQDSTLSESEAYQRAFQHLYSNNYQQAEKELRQFIKRYPKSDYADNAQYWVAESFYARQKFKESIGQFQKVFQYKTSDKHASALLKQGYAFYELKKMDEARAFLQKVINDFPKSNEASKAKRRLQLIRPTS